MLGLLAQARIRQGIIQQFPRLQEDCERGGLASYVKEVGVDVGYVDDEKEEEEEGEDSGQNLTAESTMLMKRSS